MNAHKVVDHVFNWQVSLNGQWLLAEKRPTPQSGWYAVNIGTGRMVQRPHQDDEQEYDAYDNRGLIHAVWRQDSGGWIQATEGQADHKTHVFFYDLMNPLVNEHAEDFMLYGRNVIGCYSTERVLAVNSYTGAGGAIGFADFSVLPTTKPRELYFQYVPANMNVCDAALSPHADRIAWEFEVRRVPFGFDALRNSN